MQPSCGQFLLVVFELKLVTFLIPEAYLKGLDKLVDEGLYPSRSAAIRFALQDLLRREFWQQAEVVGEEVTTRKVRVKHMPSAVT
jgi:antitoxin ParD1/3/4